MTRTFGNERGLLDMKNGKKGGLRGNPSVGGSKQIRSSGGKKEKEGKEKKREPQKR